MQLTTDAIVLHRVDYRDYDRMVTLFSPELGRIDAVARGCRKPTSPLMNSAEMFCAGQYTLHVSGGRHTITQCEIKDSFFDLRLDYDRLLHGMYYLSLADMAALPDQSAPEVFFLLLKALAHLCYSGLDARMLTACFEMRYMPLMGFRPMMDRCVICGTPVDGEGRFDEARGGVVCLRCPSHAPRISAGARRIIMKAPMTDYSVVPKLDGHPDWPEAARLYRPFVERRIERRFRQSAPDTPPTEEKQ